MLTTAHTTRETSTTTESEILNPEALAQLSDIYLISNTPGYLYRHYINIGAVAKLRELLGPHELVATAMAVDKSYNRTASDLARAYASLVALTMFEPRESRAAVVGVTFSNLAWAENIISRGTESPIETVISDCKGSQPRIIGTDSSEPQCVGDIVRMTGNP